jgi:Xaa-Pro dipeptidase
MDAVQVPEKELQGRIERVQRAVQKKGLDALFLVQRVDVSYLTGMDRQGIFYVPAEGAPLLFVAPSLARGLENREIHETVTAASLGEIPREIRKFYGRLPRLMGFEYDVLPVADFNLYRGLFPGVECVDGSSAILEVRRIKSDWELARMEETARLTEETFRYGKSVLRPGLEEMAFAALLEGFARVRGRERGSVRVRDYQTEGYAWHVLSGRSGGMVGLLDSPASGEGTSAAFPCGAGRKPIEAHEPVMVDFSFLLRGYHMDETRMFSIGEMEDRVREACEAAIAIHDAVLSRVKPGVSMDALYQHSVEQAEERGYGDQYLGPPGNKVSFIGHGIGLELIEGPIIAKGKKDQLQPGMTFALEPKIVFQDEFIAGVESVFVVTEDGYRFLSRVPVEILVC